MLTRLTLAVFTYFITLTHPLPNESHEKRSQAQIEHDESMERINRRGRSASNLYCAMEGGENCYVDCRALTESTFVCMIIAQEFHASLRCRQEEGTNGLWCSDVRTLYNNNAQ
jgi:hypothetical protein